MISITEYPSLANIGAARSPYVQDIGLEGAGSSVVTTTVISSGGTVSTINLQPTTNWIRIAASANGWVLCSPSSASTSIVTATNAGLSPANTIEIRGVNPSARITALST